jgi:hypothetical protein
LEHRYGRFVEAKLKIQGIAFANTNRVVREDRLASTFDAFVDVAWLRSFPPIRLLNKVKSHAGRLIDYDMTLDIQHNEITDSERDMVPMPLEDFVHPSQMVHQYTMFRRHPAKALPCFSVPLIPFYDYISMGNAALTRAIAQIRSRTSKCFPFLGEGLLIEFERLDVAQVDWCLKQIVQCCVGRKIEPFPELYQYGLELYHLVESPDSWKARRRASGWATSLRSSGPGSRGVVRSAACGEKAEHQMGYRPDCREELPDDRLDDEGGPHQGRLAKGAGDE